MGSVHGTYQSENSEVFSFFGSNEVTFNDKLALYISIDDYKEVNFILESTRMFNFMQHGEESPQK